MRCQPEAACLTAVFSSSGRRPAILRSLTRLPSAPWSNAEPRPQLPLIRSAHFPNGSSSDHKTRRLESSPPAFENLERNTAESRHPIYAHCQCITYEHPSIVFATSIRPSQRILNCVCAALDLTSNDSVSVHFDKPPINLSFNRSA